MTDNPFANLAAEVVWKGHRVRALGPHEATASKPDMPKTWHVYLYAERSHPDTDLLVLAGRDRPFMLEAACVWDEFATAFSDPLIALQYLR